VEDDDDYDDEDYQDDSSTDDGPSYILIDDDEEELDIPSPSEDQTYGPTSRIELEVVSLGCGLVRKGDTVELIDESDRVSTGLLSGDFLRITRVVQDVATDGIQLEGFLLRRCSYMQPMFEREYRTQLFRNALY
jgi:hypothetical protein